MLFTFKKFLRWGRLYKREYGAKELSKLRPYFKSFNKSTHSHLPPGWEHNSALVICRHCKNKALIQRYAYGIENFKLKGITCIGCQNCSDCCKCVQCSQCHNNTAKLCENCNKGSCCCQCQYCGECNTLCNNSICYNCDYCYSCCECNHSIEFFNQEPKFHTPSKTQTKLNTSTRFIAAEIEVADIDENKSDLVAKAVKDWGGSIVQDGSLPENGFEINTAPAGGDLFVRQIDEICSALKKSSAKVDDSCGLHIHINAKDFNYYDVRRLMKVYAKIEDALFGMLPYRRKKSHYCRPCGKNYIRNLINGRVPYKKVKSSVIKTIYKDETTQNHKNVKHDSSRYVALNLHSWFYRGTVECRMFSGTTQSSKIVPWGIIWAKILDYTIANTDESIEELSDKTPFDALMIVVKEKHLQDFIALRTKEWLESRKEKNA